MNVPNKKTAYRCEVWIREIRKIIPSFPAGKNKYDLKNTKKKAPSHRAPWSVAPIHSERVVTHQINKTMVIHHRLKIVGSVGKVVSLIAQILLFEG